MDSTRKIEWTDENVGYVTTGSLSTKTVCYSLKHAIYREMLDCVKQLVNNPLVFQNNEDINLAFGHFRPLGSVEPKLSVYRATQIRLTINIKSRAYLTSMIVNGDIDVNDNFTFLAKLGFTRNWKRDCAICLTEEIMGTACTCGHTEIVMFRPCGHAVCASPCFKELNQRAGLLVLKPKEYIVCGIKMITPTSLNYDAKVEVNYNCPICIQPVSSVFQTEEVRIPESYQKDIMGLLETSWSDFA